MTTLPFDDLTPAQRLTLIGELWDSLDTQAIPVTSAQKAEIDRRLLSLDEDVAQGRSAEAIIAELDGRSH